MVLDWDKARGYLDAKLKLARKQLRDSDESERALGRRQGRVAVLEEMLNLPQALEMVKDDEDDG